MRQLKWIGLLLALMMVNLPAAAAEEGTPPAVPVATFQEITHVFPATLEGVDVSHDFVIRNTGGAPLMIDDVQTYCGCVSASFQGGIPAGGEGAITIKLSTSGYGGRTVVQKADVLTNDPVNKAIRLTIQCPVDRFAESNPNMVVFKGPLGFVMKQQVQIIPGEKYPFKITGSKARDGKYIRFELKQATLEGRAAYIIDVENTKTDVGTYQDFILLETDNSVQPLLKLKVFGDIYDPAKISTDVSAPTGTKQ
ncbi:MAG: DUF1573 domain-containing protein [Thermodesulfobacteriota bacterium]